MKRNNHITVSAAGQGSRIRDAMNGLGFPLEMPKSLLPTGQGETLLGRIIRQASVVGHVLLYVNYDHARMIGESSDIPNDISLLINRNIYGPLGPIYLDLFRTRKRCMMAAGDFWANLDWTKFLEFHDSHNMPISIVVGRSSPTNDGAKFIINGDFRVKSWERVPETTEHDLINIGAYIIDPTNEVIEKLQGLDITDHKEDSFNNAMIPEGLMAAYVLEEPSFNVNNIDVYNAMLNFNKVRPTKNSLSKNK